jgi:signal transduction histidine kinase
LGQYYGGRGLKILTGKEEIRRMISETPFFSNVPDEVLQRFSENAQYRVFPANNIIFRQGDPSDSLYIIHSGRVRIFRRSKDMTETELVVLGSGDIFGEMAMLADEPRAGYVEATEETHTIVIPKEQFKSILKDYPQVISVFLKKLHNLIIQSDLKIEFNKKLVEYEKLSALGRLTANVAHEIRNPISVIAGFTERLEKTISVGTKEREYLEIISSEIKRLEEILREVLDYSEEPLSRREEHDINKIVEECLDMYEAECRNSSIQVITFLNNATPVYVDQKQVVHTINILISNAIEAMPEGGTLTVSTKETFIGNKNYVAMEISDTGIGIPEENLPMIFEPFFTTKVTKKETGLGLPIAKKIVESHSGLMKVTSVVGKGSVFTVFFPYRKKRIRS